MRGRDAQRKSDLKKIANGLELYFSDHSKYPPNLPGPDGEFKDLKGTIYIKSMPKDPSGYEYTYDVNDDGYDKYHLFAYLEISQDKNIDPLIVAQNHSCGDKICNFGISSTNIKPSDPL